ncbi:MAG TPA: SIMPL domain-containing protein [Gammaproteobacteria bacterium]|nr:SIMPL domain-containing protein [Gammaproteobacteria bacterium]
MRRRIPFAIAALLFVPLQTLAGGLPSAPYIQVSGHGEISVAPDMLYVGFTVTRTDPVLSVARTDVEQRSDKVFALAKRLEIAARDIQAEALYVAPEYTWRNNSREFVGQRVTRTFRITLRNLKQYPALIDGLVNAGISSMDSVTPSRSDLPALQTRALSAAMDDARARAEALATSAQVKLGAVYRISDTGRSASGPRPMMLGAARTAAQESATYEPGQIEISADVEVVYLLSGTQ